LQPVLLALKSKPVHRHFRRPVQGLWVEGLFLLWQRQQLGVQAVFVVWEVEE
jgi:hypothetical protein